MPPIPQKTRPGQQPRLPVDRKEEIDALAYDLKKLKRKVDGLDGRLEEAEEGVDSLNQTTTTRGIDYDEEAEYTSLTFTGVFPGRTYRISFTDLSWFEEETSQIVIGYNQGGTFTALLTITEEPEENEFTVTLPDDSTPDNIEVRITGECSGEINLTDVTDTQNMMEDISQPDVELTEEQIANIFANLGLDTILEEINETLADFEDRIYALEHPSS